MKFAVGLVVIVWLLCGLIGAWWLDDVKPQYWLVVAKGPISLARAFNENPAHLPGPD